MVRQRPCAVLRHSCRCHPCLKLSCNTYTVFLGTKNRNWENNLKSEWENGWDSTISRKLQEGKLTRGWRQQKRGLALASTANAAIQVPEIFCTKGWETFQILRNATSKATNFLHKDMAHTFILQCTFNLFKKRREQRRSLNLAVIRNSSWFRTWGGAQW